MSDTTPPSGTHGAFDLSDIAAVAPTADGVAGVGESGPGSPSDPFAAAPAGLVEQLGATNLEKALMRSLQVPSLLVLWSSAHQQTIDFLRDVIAMAATRDGRILVLTADLSADPTLMQAFQPILVQAFGQPNIPATFGVLQGQPVPLFPGVAPRDQISLAIDQLLQAAVANGIAGRVDLGPAPEGAEPELSPAHQAAFDAIESGDYDAAIAAYEGAIADDPKDSEAVLGLAQVRLMQRTAGVDLAAARAKAGADPSDIDAALQVADLDVLGGHVEDAFARLIDLVRDTVGEDRTRVRDHLVGLFDVVGSQDERVKRGRTSLMSALF